MPTVLAILTWMAAQLEICCLGELQLFYICFALFANSNCSDFTPTCSECSTVHPAPGVPAVRGESAMAICRQCHRKMGMFRMIGVLELTANHLGYSIQDPRGEVLIGGQCSK